MASIHQVKYIPCKWKISKKANEPAVLSIQINNIEVSVCNFKLVRVYTVLVTKNPFLIYFFCLFVPTNLCKGLTDLMSLSLADSRRY